ncbi:MAG: IS21 family transposase [Alphaproteobacteria bacterium]|nr:IS21 family transposase [Alphaproteobacteria bacterium]
MLIVETIGRVRRDHFVEKKSIKRIARERGLSRNTVRKILRSEETAFRYERARQPLPQLGPHVALLETLLTDNGRKGRRERLTMTGMFERLEEAGYAGGYDAIRRHARQWKRDNAQAAAGEPVAAFVPLWFAPGEAYQFDWSHEIVVLAGVTTTVKVAHIRLCHSRMFLVVAYPRETQEMVFDAHDRAFRFFGGACRKGIYDNMKTAVDAIFTGKERRFNRRFEQMCSHHLVEPVACTPASGWEKGQVENQVGNVREWFFTPRARFASLAELNDWLMARCLKKAASLAHPEFKERSVAEVFAEEKDLLIAYRRPFDGFHETHVSASKCCLARFDRNRYSVDATAANRPVTVHAYADRVVIRHGGVVVADHARVFGRDRTVYEPWHYVPVLAGKPGALRNGAPFRNWEPSPMLAEIRWKLGSGDDADRQFVEILMAARESGLEAVEAACAEALAAGLATSAVVLNFLGRQGRPAAVEPVATPDALKLDNPPSADCARYDALLRGACHGTA